MYRKIILIIILFSVLSVILFSTNAELYPSEIGKMLSDFEDERNVIVDFVRASDDFPDENCILSMKWIRKDFPILTCSSFMPRLTASPR